MTRIALEDRFLSIIQQGEDLHVDHRNHFDRQSNRALDDLENTLQRHQEVQAAPILPPNLNPKRTWQKKKIKGRVDARALTDAEIAQRDLQAREAERRAIAQ